MWAKLFRGELSLGATFWKYGVLGLVILHYVLRMFESFLNTYLKGRSIYDFFMHHFHLVYSPKMSLWWALCYMATFVLLLSYSYRMVVAVWRSAAAYQKSVWLAQLARIGIFIIVAVIWYPFIMRYL